MIEIGRTKSSPAQVFADFCRMAACAVALHTREEEYAEASARYTPEERSKISQAFASLVDEMNERPFQDVLGVFYQEVNADSTRDARGEFYTPPPVSELMARISVDVDAAIEKGRITISDPCCGSGGMILALAKQFAPTPERERSEVDVLRVTLQDLSPTACDMAYVNTTLWGIPARIICGNTLTLETTADWTNIHWHRVGEPMHEALATLCSEPTKPQAEVASAAGEIQTTFGL